MRRYPPRLTVGVRGLTSSDLYREAGDDDRQEPALVLDPYWALVLLQVCLLAEAYRKSSFESGDDYVQSNYTVYFLVEGVGAFTPDHLVSIVDGE
jgi:hypothetical protein